MTDWIKEASQIAYSNQYFQVKEDQVRQPGGQKGTYVYVEKPDFILVIPEIEEQLVLVEQYRYPIQKRSLEFPQGNCERHENYDNCMERELLEETGYHAQKLHNLGKIYLGSGLTTQGCIVYHASKLSFVKQRLESSESDIRVLKYSISEVKTLIAKNEIQDSPTVAAFNLFLLQRK